MNDPFDKLKSDEDERPKLVTDVPDPPTKVTPEMLEQLKREASDWNEVMHRAASAMKPQSNNRPDSSSTEFLKKGTCVVCNGDVVQKITYHWRGPRRVGFDAKEKRNAYNTSTAYHGYHCSKCGLKYEFPPPGDDTPPPG